jgi:glycosyltransferase involved in cell wall biosynthesis
VWESVIASDADPRAAGLEAPPVRTIALLPWGDIFEDWLDPLGVSLDDFLTEMRGSWMFGYADALALAGVRTVFVCVTRRVREPIRRTHVPTGATTWFLPSPRLSSALRDRIAVSAGDVRGLRRLGRSLAAHSASYLGMPMRSLARVVGSERCDAILCQEYESPRFDLCVLAGTFLRVPVFATFQGGDYASPLERPFRRLAVRASAGLIVATASEATRVRRSYGVSDAKLARIFNPIDTAFWRPVDRQSARDALAIPPDARLVVWHGQAELRRKGLDVLVAAWELVRQARPGQKLQLLLVGTGEDAASLHRRLAASDVGDVRFDEKWLLDRGEIRQYLSAGDVYAFPSRHEGFPVALIEAMACGLPVVAADAEGVSDIVEGSERSGGIVVPRDDPQAFARALVPLLDDEVLARDLGARARRRVEDQFSLEAVGGELARFLASATGARRKGRW